MDSTDVRPRSEWTGDNVGPSMIALVPVAWCALFWGLVVRVALNVGEWPHAARFSPFDPRYEPTTIDPKVFGVHADLVW